eukprot:CAMPEP_0118958674 /NCGR_PEP_ID=MMETSP1169-20130426/62744_1 /TAXON_ID=36882 /ORGANISM="Pyramimonas obovata, Strain CCMP722" /LENGTH=548 /DNA_ID=CAMNT_0006906799 /DNA_START=39 /DNA_END=1685 /DNA_ORIENTATION=+
MGFLIPAIVDNPDGWGPCTLPEEYKDIPYAPFSKSDKLGRASDWINQGYSKSRFGNQSSGVNSAFNFFANDEEDTFHLVDTKTVSRPKYGARRYQHNRNNNRRQQETAARDSGAGAERERARRERQQQKKNQWSGFWNNRNNQQFVYTSSVDIRPEWTVLDQIQLTSLTKLSYDVSSEPEEITDCGHLKFYNKTFDRIGAKQEVPLKRFDKRVFHQVTTSDDPIIARLKGAEESYVFATDAILATLMCAPRSVYSWDIVITRQGNKMYLDKRDRSNFDLLSVHETAQEPIPDEKDNMNGVINLSHEATVINQNFSQQVLQQGGETLQMAEKNPFVSDNEDVAPVAYRYRKWQLDDKVSLVARCELNAVLDYKGQQLVCAVRSLNEFDPKVTGIDWRKKLENQRGAVIATELKNNANKLAKWTVQALLGGADQLKFGYVTRAHPRDNYNHVILGTQFYKPKDFAAQINLNVNNMWGILKTVVDMCMKLGDGKYVLVKDPNKPLLRLYEVPMDAFEEDFAEEALPAETEAPPEVNEKPKEADDEIEVPAI